MAAACNRTALMGVAALPHIHKSRLAARPWQRRLPSHHHAVPSVGIIQCRARDFSTLTSNPGKDGGSWDDSIDSQKMLYLRRRIEDLKSQERATQAEEENYSMLYLRRRIEHVKVRELMMQAEEETQLHDIQSCTSDHVRLENWMKWERDYEVFYQEEVRSMMARLQDWLLQCQPSFSMAILLCLCVVGGTGAFTILSTLIWSLFFPTLFYIWQALLFH